MKSDVMSHKGQRVAVLGLGITGFESAMFLKRNGFDVFASEINRSDSLEQRRKELSQHNIDVEIGRHSEERILKSDWVLISPGIPPTSTIYRKLSEKKMTLYSEIEVASWFCPTPHLIAVTGTSGKTTLATLITRMLQRENVPVVSCGNIGNPFIGELDRIGKEHFVVLELSSFQLLHCYEFSPRIAVLLNLSPNHEDWHQDIKAYIAAKLRIFQNQSQEDFAIIRKSDRNKYFSEHSLQAKLVYSDEDGLDNPHLGVLRQIAKLLNIPQSRANEVVESFRGLEHRLEHFAESEGITFVNDSKCTTTASLMWALSKYPDQTIVLIAGGRPKSKDYLDACDLLRKKVKGIILYGEGAKVLMQAWQGVAPIAIEPEFKKAVELACEKAHRGDIILLSPACASFDLFQNYQHRGKVFKEFIQERLSLLKQS